MRNELLIFLLSPLLSLGQKKEQYFEVATKIRYDNYADFEDRFADRSYTTRLKLKGISWGVDAKYKMAINDNWNMKVGIGYYKYTFNHIRNYFSQFNTTDKGRELNLLRPIYILYNTDKYWYNSINLSVGVERKLPITTKYEAVLGFQINNLFSYSQRYNIPLDKFIEKKSNFHYYAFSAVLGAGINRRVNNFYYGPHLIFPTLDNWSNDQTLSQVSARSRRKLFNGIEINFVFGFLLNK